MAEIQGWNAETMSFSDTFQKEILIAMIQNPRLYESLGIYINPESFEIRAFNVLFTNIKQYYEDYKSIPNKECLYELIDSYYRKNNKNIPDFINESLNEIYDSKRLTISTTQFVEDNIRNFIQNQALKKAIIDSLEDLDDLNKHPNIKNRIEEALSIGADINDLGVDIYSDDEILDRWKRRLSGEEIQKYSTGWNMFDNVFGGYGCGEVFSYMGPANSGKSMYLVNAGANLILQKKNVLHISLEMSPETVAQRYDMRLLGLNKEELKTTKANQKIQELLERDILGKLIVKRYPSSTINSNDIVSFIKKYENTKGILPDVLIIDYADIMLSTRKYNERRYELDTIYQEIRNIGIEFNIPVITATQLNREGLKELENGGLLTEAHIAESYGISRHADVLVTINSTASDIINHKSTIYVAKNRDGRKGDTIGMYVDFEKSMVKEWNTVLK